MIKCNKGEVWIDGNKHVILAECGMLLNEVYHLLAKKEGEERAKEDMEIMLETVFLSDEELEAKNKAISEELPPGLKELAEFLVDIFGSTAGGGGESSPCDAEEE